MEILKMVLTVELEKIRSRMFFRVLNVLGKKPDLLSLQVLRIFSAPRQFMETFQKLCKLEENEEVFIFRLIVYKSAV